MSDLISRQDVIELVKKSYYDLSDGEEDMWAMVHDVEQLPSAPDSRQRGEWIFEPKDAIELMFTKPKCSKCGFESADGGNFCSNCGTDMRGEEE